MRLKKEQIEKISKIVLKHLQNEKLITPKATDSVLLARINRAITDNLTAEDQLDEQVEQLMGQLRQQIREGQLNERELFLKIKKEMAKKKKFVL